MAEARVIDIASWQHPGGARIDWEAVAKSGVVGVMIKVSQGTSYKNPYYGGDGGVQSDYDDAKAAGLLVGAYHFAEPGASDAATQAQFAQEALGTRRALDLGLALDFEQLGNLPAHEASGWAESWLNLVHENVSLCPFYTDQSILNSLLGAPWTYPLWIADPSNTYQGQPWMRQHAQGSVEGITGQVDLDTLYSVRGVNPAPGGGTVAPPAETLPPNDAPPPPPPAPPAPNEGTAEVQLPILSETAPGPNVVNDTVLNLQRLLASHGFDVGALDGRYGQRTAASVVACEQHYGLGVDAGVTGPQVWDALLNKA